MVNDSVVYQGNYIILDTLNKIFNQRFVNGQLLVYIDGELVFNDSVNDDVRLIILKIIDKYLGIHELKVIFTDENNNTQNFTEYITII